MELDLAASASDIRTEDMPPRRRRGYVASSLRFRSNDGETSTCRSNCKFSSSIVYTRQWSGDDSSTGLSSPVRSPARLPPTTSVTVQRTQNFAAKAAAQRLAQVIASQASDNLDDDNDVDDDLGFRFGGNCSGRSSGGVGIVNKTHRSPSPASRSFPLCSSYSSKFDLEDLQNPYIFNGPSNKSQGSNREMRRKKRIASYNMFSSEVKLKSSFRGSFKWIKTKITDML